MVSFRGLALLIILTTSLYHQGYHRLVSRADQTLISTVCAKTGQNRNLCLDCFRARGGKLSLGIKQMAQASISCSSSVSFSARQAMEDLGKDSTGQLAENCFACVRELDETLLEFIDAGKDVGAGRNGDGVNHMNRSHDRVLNCLNLVGSEVAELATVKGDVEMAISIINQISMY